MGLFKKSKKLSKELIKEGRIKALENAEELLEEAELLNENGFFSRTIFLTQISAEELGKYLLLLNSYIELLKNETSFNWKKFWKNFLSHSYKYEMVSYFEDIFLEEIKQLDEYYKELKQKISDMEQFKQLNLYSDFIEDIVIKPSEWPNQEMAKHALDWARGRYNLFNNFENDVIKKSIDQITKEKLNETSRLLLEKFPELKKITK